MWFQRKVVEAEAEHGGGRRGAIDGEGARVKEGPIEDVEVGPEGDDDQVAGLELVHVLIGDAFTATVLPVPLAAEPRLVAKGVRRPRPLLEERRSRQ